MKDYFGWIPTITGRLSFSTIGTGKNPKKEFKFFKSLGMSRCTVVAQKRRTTDAVFNGFGDYLNRRRGRDGYSVFVFFGETNKSSEFSLLSGPCVELDIKNFDELKPYLIELDQLTNPKEIRAKFEECANLFLEAAAVRPGAYSAIEMLRNGKTKISFLEDDRLSRNVSNILASQVYFFLRDITHLHQHHAPTTDTILDVTPASEGENGWKRETLYSLYRWVIHRKRDKSLFSLINCAGVLAYAQAFEKTHCLPAKRDANALYKSGRLKEPFGSENPSPPRYNHDTTLASVQAGVELLRDQEKTRFDFFDTATKFFTILAALVALVSPLYSRKAGSDLTGQQELFAKLTQWVNQNIILVVGGCLALAILLSLSTVVRRHYSTSKLLHDGLRVFLSLFKERWMAVTVLAILFVAVLGLTLYVASSSYSGAVESWVGPGRI